MTATQSMPPIMVVEDDDHISQILKFMLERQGWRTLLATDGLAARKLVEEGQERPALILLDVMLPYIDGFELVQIVRKTPGWENIPIVMLTAKNMERDIVRALDAGANDYIVKPFQPNELLARVRRFLKDKP
ncbi:response regulator transcription factor [Noviherbaspirillum denitrificans]|uniref:Two-component system response regulator n=1 Tax=Noviherbaspirillum denitrificans TaxID=1968433 RepID=A0A254TK73_9BURK|nr:response regulator [Noviherbaspirillum denitrificans]OWW21003.1 two-component system response regulator [Noviherbaspirillum denitrificans]